MAFLEDIYFGKRGEAELPFNNTLTLGEALDIPRQRFLTVQKAMLGQNLDTLCAFVRLYEEGFDFQYKRPTVVIYSFSKECGLKSRKVEMPVKQKVSGEENKDPRFFMVFGDKDNLQKGIYYVRADMSRETGGISSFKVNEANRGPPGYVSAWVERMISAYYGFYSNVLQTEPPKSSFEKFHLFYWGDEYSLHMDVVNDPNILKLHTRTGCEIMYNGTDYVNKENGRSSKMVLLQQLS